MRYIRDGRVIVVKDGMTNDTGIRAYHHRFGSRGCFLGELSYTQWANTAIEKFANGEPIGEWKDDSIGGYCERYVHLMYNIEIRSNRGTPYSANSIKTYSNAASCLYRYGKGIKLDADRKAYREFFKSFEHWLERSMNAKSRFEIVNAIQIMVRYWCRELDLPIPETHRMAKTEKPIVVVPPELISKVVSDDRFIGTLIQPHWEVAVTILLTTLRLSDIQSLRPEHLEGGFIVKDTQKTGQRVTIPIPERLREIFSRNLKNGSLWSGPIDNIHGGLRLVFQKYPEMWEMHTAGVTQYLWEFVTPHMLRKSAITGLIFFGVDHISVRHASGHSQNSSAFWKYVKVVDSRFKSAISDGHAAMLKTISTPSSQPS
jgi:integrase